MVKRRQLLLLMVAVVSLVLLGSLFLPGDQVGSILGTWGWDSRVYVRATRGEGVGVDMIQRTTVLPADGRALNKAIAELQDLGWELVYSDEQTVRMVSPGGAQRGTVVVDKNTGGISVQYLRQASQGERWIHKIQSLWTPEHA